MRPAFYNFLLLLAWPLSALPAGEAVAPTWAPAVNDYLIILTADSIPYNPTKAHLFVALVRVEEGPRRAPRVVEQASMSWLPATMKVRPLALRPETGRNVPLDETLRFYLATGSRICRWGPYRVQPELAQMFKARVATVESCFAYKGVCFLEPRDVCDCARAVEELLPRGGSLRRYIGVFGYGAAAGSHLVRAITPWLIEPEQSHPWVATLIGLDAFGPTIFRPFGDYTSRLGQLTTIFRRK
jgi:hypothetical protein